MTYNEKLKFAENGVSYLLSGGSLSSYKTKLSDSDLDKFEIEKVVRSIKNILNENYGSKIKKLLLEDKLGDVNNNFLDLDNEIFNFIVEKEINNINQDTKKEIIDLVRKGVKVDSISDIVESKYLSKDEIDIYSKNYLKENKHLKPFNRKINLIFGILAILVAIWNFSVTGRLFVPILLFISGVFSLDKSRIK